MGVMTEHEAIYRNFYDAWGSTGEAELFVLNSGRDPDAHIVRLEPAQTFTAAILVTNPAGLHTPEGDAPCNRQVVLCGDHPKCKHCAHALI